MKQNIKITCKGISDLTPRSNYTVDISLDECELDFISELSGEDIVSNCNDINELIEAIDDEYIFEYLVKQGVVFNKG